MGIWFDARQWPPVWQAGQPPPAAPAWPPQAARHDTPGETPKPAPGQPQPDPAADAQPATPLTAIYTGNRLALPPEPVPAEQWISRIGREYGEAFMTEFCEAIADGDTLHSLSLRQDMPSRPTIRKMMREHPSFFHAYNVARRARADARADRIDEISKMVAEKKLDPYQGRLMVSTEQWQASREHPNRYGEKVTLDTPPPAPAGRITLDPSDPKASEAIVMAVFASIE